MICILCLNKFLIKKYIKNIKIIIISLIVILNEKINNNINTKSNKILIIYMYVCMCTFKCMYMYVQYLCVFPNLNNFY